MELIPGEVTLVVAIQVVYIKGHEDPTTDVCGKHNSILEKLFDHCTCHGSPDLQNTTVIIDSIIDRFPLSTLTIQLEALVQRERGLMFFIVTDVAVTLFTFYEHSQAYTCFAFAC